MRMRFPETPSEIDAAVTAAMRDYDQRAASAIEDTLDVLRSQGATAQELKEIELWLRADLAAERAKQA